MHFKNFHFILVMLPSFSTYTPTSITFFCRFCSSSLVFFGWWATLLSLKLIFCCWCCHFFLHYKNTTSKCYVIVLLQFFWIWRNLRKTKHTLKNWSYQFFASIGNFVTNFLVTIYDFSPTTYPSMFWNKSWHTTTQTMPK